MKHAWIFTFDVYVCVTILFLTFHVLWILYVFNPPFGSGDHSTDYLQQVFVKKEVWNVDVVLSCFCSPLSGCLNLQMGTLSVTPWFYFKTCWCPQLYLLYGLLLQLFFLLKLSGQKDWSFIKLLNHPWPCYQDDTINLFTYAVLRLTPHALSSGSSSWSYLRKGSTVSNAASESNMTHPNSMSESFYGSSDISSGEDGHYHVVRPLQSDKWSKGKDGYLVTDLWGAEVGTWVFATPTVWLQQTGEKLYLCVYQHRSLTLMLMIPVSSVPNGEQGVAEVRQRIIENVSLLIRLIFCFLTTLLLLHIIWTDPYHSSVFYYII